MAELIMRECAHCGDPVGYLSSREWCDGCEGTGETEQPQNWHFTWGHGQTLPDGTDAYNCYTIINGTFIVARGEMFARFGQAWSFDYSEATGVDVAREYNMRFVEASRFPKRFEADGTTPLPTPSGRCGESVPQAGDAS
jgi:hypothetical protein